MGSFYNHFHSKEELFQAAVNEVLDELGAILDKLTAEGEDPAETFARSFRLVGRLFIERPAISRVLLNTRLTLISANRGLAPRALRDIDAAVRAGRFSVDDPMLALAVAGGALMGLGQLLHDQPKRDVAEAADRVTRDVLVMFGLPTRRGRLYRRLPGRTHDARSQDLPRSAKAPTRFNASS